LGQKLVKQHHFQHLAQPEQAFLMIKYQLLTVYNYSEAGSQSFLNFSAQLLKEKTCHTNMAKVKQLSIE
jgi:hypothetical protein